MNAAVQQKLLIISRDALLEAEPLPSSEHVFRRLSSLNRSGFHLLLTAPEPDHWLPTRGNVDDALNSQGKLQERIHSAGGELDGVYYVPRSLFTQDRNRTGALRDILQRYTATPSQAILVSSSIPFLKAAERLGIQTHEITVSGQEESNLLAELNMILSSIS
jgi:hypothetical protein